MSKPSYLRFRSSGLIDEYHKHSERRQKTENKNKNKKYDYISPEENSKMRKSTADLTVAQNTKGSRVCCLTSLF